MDSKEQFIRKLRKHEVSFSPSDRKIADYLIQSYPTGLLESTTLLAEKLGLSGATISRFFPKVGFKSIRQAQETARVHLNFLKDSPLDRYLQKGRKAAQGNDQFYQAWELDISNIQRTYQGLSQDQVDLFMDLVFTDQACIYILGERKAFALSFYLYVQINALRPRVVLVKTDQSMIADSAAQIGKNDILITFDLRRYLKVNLKLTQTFKSAGAQVVVIGDSPISPSAKLADILFLIESKGLSLFDSYTAGFTLINALLVQISRLSGDYVLQRYENLERSYRRFEVFSSQEMKPDLEQLSARDTSAKE